MSPLLTLLAIVLAGHDKILFKIFRVSFAATDLCGERGKRDLKLSCNLCNFCPEGVDSCQGVGTGEGQQCPSFLPSSYATKRHICFVNIAYVKGAKFEYCPRKRRRREKKNDFSILLESFFIAR